MKKIKLKIIDESGSEREEERWKGDCPVCGHSIEAYSLKQCRRRMQLHNMLNKKCIDARRKVKSNS